jgi:hypothetical protein
MPLPEVAAGVGGAQKKKHVRQTSRSWAVNNRPADNQSCPPLAETQEELPHDVATQSGLPPGPPGSGLRHGGERVRRFLS